MGSLRSIMAARETLTRVPSMVTSTSCSGVAATPMPPTPPRARILMEYSASKGKSCLMSMPPVVPSGSPSMCADCE